MGSSDSLQVTPVIQVFEREDGTKQYMPCFMIHRESENPSAGELASPDKTLYDTLAEASAQSQVLLEELLNVLENVVKSVKNQDA